MKKKKDLSKSSGDIFNYSANGIKFKYKDAIYIIDMNSIMYIEKESHSEEKQDSAKYI